MPLRPPVPAPAASGARQPGSLPGGRGLPGSGELFAHAFEHAGIGMALLREDGRFEAANRALAGLLGHADLRGHALRDLLHESAREELMTALALVHSGHGDGRVGEHRWTRADGTTALVRTTATLTDGGSHLVLTVEDAGPWREAERKRAEEALAKHARELERSNAELEQFAYVASHDLSEPLRMITSYLQLLERRYSAELDEDARDFIHYAVDGAARMRALIDDLLAYSRVGRGGLQDEPVDLGAVAHAVVETLAVAREPQPAIAIGELPTVSGDPGQLAQLLQNLVGNAIKFTRPGEAAQIEISAREADGGWELAVADRGIGIDPEHSERIFRVFQRLHARDDYPGTGVGLAIARKVVDGHGGRIWAEPRDGGGTVFRIELPGGGR